jgi:hypothetical protein
MGRKKAGIGPLRRRYSGQGLEYSISLWKLPKSPFAALRDDVYSCHEEGISPIRYGAE